LAKEITYTNEGDVKKQIKKLLNQHGWFWWMPPANGFGRTGIADFNALRGGVFLAIEAKFGTNKPTVMQVGFLESVTSESGMAFVVNEKNLDALAVWLERFDQAVKAQSEGRDVEQSDGAAMVDAMAAMRW
jgi:hypothetical protein